MNHSFHPSLTDALKCAHCKFPEIQHTSEAICETCNNVAPVDIVYGNMLMCKDCQDKESKAYAESMKPENQQKRVAEHNLALESARKVDASIAVRTDLFNSATVAIVDLCKLIDDDATIENKPYAKALELKTRFDKFQAVIFKANEEIVEANNNQKAIQVYLNQLANTLRAEEREKLKISDINYRPTTVKPVSPPKIKPKKLDKTLVRKAAAELGITEFVLTQFILMSGGDLDKAVIKIKASIAAAKG